MMIFVVVVVVTDPNQTFLKCTLSAAECKQVTDSIFWPVMNQQKKTHVTIG